MAVVDVLEYFGCKVDFPEGQTCCGQPQFNNGYPEQARGLALRMIRVFADSTHVVTPSGSCCAMIRDHYPALFKDSAEETDALAFVAKTYEFVEFLTKILKVDVNGLALPKETSLTYHYTCHTRGLGLKESAGSSTIDIVRKLRNARFVPLEKAEQCCGFGGTFAVKFSEISGAMAADKVKCGEASGAQVMIVNDAGCAMNIGGACRRKGGAFAVKHIAEVLAEAVGRK